MLIISYFIQIALLKVLIWYENKPIVISNLIANAAVYIIFTLATLIEYIPKRFLKIENNIINLILILTIESVLLFLLSKQKRIRNGIRFTRDNKISTDYFDMIIINISAVIIFIYCLFIRSNGDYIKQVLFPFIILGFIMFIMIQKTLILYYKQKLLKETLEEFVKNSKSEASDEIGIMDKIQSLSKEYSGKVEEIKTADRLYTTNIPEIDDMFKYTQSECKNNNIDFNLQINGNIFYMINNLIDKSRLVTLIGDHIRDAIIAINHSDNKNRSIIAILGMKDKYYEFSVYDTGIEFEIDTLLKLGLEPATTHKDEGGTGIGFITTFETLKETKASLVIEEKHGVVDNDYTKSVTIVFDGKNEYRIISYRSDEIKKKNKNGRIIIK